MNQNKNWSQFTNPGHVLYLSSVKKELYPKYDTFPPQVIRWNESDSHSHLSDYARLLEFNIIPTPLYLA